MEPLAGPFPVQLEGNSTISGENKLKVPKNAPPGLQYTLYLRGGNYPEILYEAFDKFAIIL